MPNLHSLLLLSCLCIGTSFSALAQPEAPPASSPVAAVDSRTNTRINPLGLTPQHLRFSWRLENAVRQNGWQVQVAGLEKELSDGQASLWDSGWREGSETAHSAFEGKSLVSGQTAWWRVRVKDGDGDGAESAWSEPARFEMGLLAEKEWHEAAWIGTTLPMDEKQLAPRDVMGDWIGGPEGAEVASFKLKFDLLDRPIVSAMAYWGTSKKTDYEFHTQYDTHDVTSLLQPSDNALAVFLDPGWLDQVGEKTWLFDLGENITGWVRLKLDEPSGTVVRLRYSEMAKTGRIMCTPRSNWLVHGMIQRDEIVCDGKPRVYESRFAFKGFRYVEVSGLSREPKPGEVVAFQVGNDAPSIASFDSSDPLLNRLFANGGRSHYGNRVDSLLDCPTREKCLWGGDLHVSWAFGFSAIDSATFYRHQVRAGFAPGEIPGLVSVEKRLTDTTDSFNWSVSPLFIVWRLYTHGGDLDTVREYYEPMRRLLDYFDQNAKEGIPHLTTYADHAPPARVERETPSNELISALNFFAAAQRFAQMARALGKPDDATWADGIAAVMHFYRSNEHTFGNGTQDSLALPFGVIDDPLEATQLAAWLLTDLAGIRFDETVPGGRRLILAPAVTPSEILDHVKASLRSPHGLIESDWRREASTVNWEFTVPPNCEARLQAPAKAVLERRDASNQRINVLEEGMPVGPGRYRMTWPQKSEI